MLFGIERMALAFKEGPPIRMAVLYVVASPDATPMLRTRAEKNMRSLRIGPLLRWIRVNTRTRLRFRRHRGRVAVDANWDRGSELRRRQQRWMWRPSAREWRSTVYRRRITQAPAARGEDAVQVSLRGLGRSHKR